MDRGFLSLVFILAFFTAESALAAGATRVAVRNDSSGPVTVSVQPSEGSAVDFGSIAPHTTSMSHPLPAAGDARIEVSSGPAKAGSVTLRAGDSNVIAVSEAGDPALDPAKPKAMSSGSGSGW